MADGAATVNGGQRDHSLCPRSDSHILVPANRCSHWDCVIIALFLLYCFSFPSSVAEVFARGHQFKLNALRISLTCVASGPLFPFATALYLHSPPAADGRCENGRANVNVPAA